MILLGAVGLGLHGFSITMYRVYIDQSREDEILLGHSQHIRADDWLLDIPLMLAQRAHRSMFPVVNGSIGLGQNMLLPLKVPVRHWVTAFRPTTWGFLIGGDVGLAWMWWTLSLALFYVFFCIFMLVSENRFWLSLLAALTLHWSPYFQFWSFHKAELAIHAGLIVLSVSGVAFARRRWAIWANGLLLAWATVGFLLDYVYPAFQVTLGYLVVFISTGFFVERARRFQWRGHLGARAAALAIATGIVVGAGLLFYLNAREIIALIARTTYPGQRFELGGGMPPWVLLANNLLVKESLANLAGNICESGGFFLFFPVILMVWAARIVSGAGGPRPLGVALALYIVANLSFTYLGFPEVLARYSLFGHVTSNRTVIGLGLADALLVVECLSQPWRPASRKSVAVVLAGWAALVIATGLGLRQASPTISPAHIVAVGLAQAVLAFWLLRGARAFMLALAGLSIAYTIGFNPWVMGGTGYLSRNPLAERILALDRARLGGSTWVVYGTSEGADHVRISVFSNLFRMLGVRSLGGHHTYPQSALWSALDPGRTFGTVENQSGFVAFFVPRGQPVEVAGGYGLILAYVDPGARAWDRLGVTHFLVIGDRPQPFERLRGLRRIDAAGDVRIYERVRNAGAGLELLSPEPYLLRVD